MWSWCKCEFEAKWQNKRDYGHLAAVAWHCVSWDLMTRQAGWPTDLFLTSPSCKHPAGENGAAGLCSSPVSPLLSSLSLSLSHTHTHTLSPLIHRPLRHSVFFSASPAGFLQPRADQERLKTDRLGVSIPLTCDSPQPRKLQIDRRLFSDKKVSQLQAE